jgi:hypothetical protein
MSRYEAAVVVEAGLNGTEIPTTSAALRQLMRDYASRIESIASSDVAVGAARVLRGRKRV